MVEFDPPSPLGKGGLENKERTGIKLLVPPYQGGFRGIGSFGPNDRTLIGNRC